MTFKGRLYFKDSKDFIEVKSLIIREDHIAFDLTTTWGEDDKWSVQGGRANKTNDGSYSGENHSWQGIIDGGPCIITLHIVSDTPDHLEVAGFWWEPPSIEGDKYEFEGELEEAAPMNSYG